MNHVRRLSGISERLQVENHILSKELDEIKAIHAKRKARASGKRFILKGRFVVSTEEIQRALEEAEKVTEAKTRKKATKNGKKRKAPVNDVSDDEACPDNVDVILEQPDNEILDCIEVEF